LALDNSLAQTFIWPATDADGVESVRITQDYAALTASLKYHAGVDIGATPQGATDNKVRAAADGTVYDIALASDGTPNGGGHGGWGNAIMLSNAPGLFTVYGHLASPPAFAVGQVVTVGTQLGIMGQTGNADGVHLHFGVRTNGSWSAGYYDDIPDGYDGLQDPRHFVLPSFSETVLSPVVVRVISGGNVNVRSGPGTAGLPAKDVYAIVTEIEPNQQFAAYRQNGPSTNYWYKIHLPNANGRVSGWVAKRFANITYLSEETTANQVEVTNTGGGGLFVRTAAGSGQPYVTTKNGAANLKIWDGQRYAVLDQTNVTGITWYKIYLPVLASQSSGWVSGEYLNFIPPPSFSGNTTGIFVNPDGPTGKVLSGTGTSHFSWGTPVVTNSPPSSLTFTGTVFSSNFYSPFSIGSLIFTNSGTSGGTEADNVTLRTTFALSSPNSLISTQEFLLRLVNTPNTNGGSADADIVRLPMAFASQLITNEGQAFGTRLTFGETTGSGFSQADEFVVLEDRSSTADLHAQFIPAVPISFTTSGVFTNPVGATNMVVTGVGTSVFTWGSPTSNRFELTATNQAAFTEQPTTLAALRYYNGSTQAGTEANSVDLRLTLNFPDEALTTNVTIKFELIATVNTNDARASADIVRLVQPQELPIIRLAGVDYALRMGFGTATTNGFSNIEEFAVLEGTNARTGIQGVFSRSIVPLPPLVLSLRKQSGSFLLTWPTELGKTYQVQASTNLPTFFPISGVITGVATAIGFVDPATNAGTKFYRVHKFP
jgi:hypothetical protein